MSQNRATGLMKGRESAPEAVPEMELRQVLGAYPTGVTVITTRDESADPVGMTANSFSSVSLDPPLILWSVRRSAMGFQVYEKAKYFGVNILSKDQTHISNLFARPGADKFASVETMDGAGGVPLIAGATAQLQCRTWNKYDGGDHLIILGEVLAFQRQGGVPLVFANGRYDKLAEKAPVWAEDAWPMSFL